MFIIPIDKNIENYNSYYNIYQNLSFKEFVISRCLEHDKKNCKTIIASCWESFKDKLSKLEEPQVNNLKNRKKIIMVMSGLGGISIKLGMSLYQNIPYYKSLINKYDSIFKQYSGFSLIESIQSMTNPNDIYEQKYSPWLSFNQIGLIDLYSHYGVLPSIVTGVSFGETPMAYASKSIDLETAIFICYSKSVLSENNITGERMIFSFLGADEYKDKYSQFYPKIEIAAYISPIFTILVGDKKEIESLKQIFDSSNVKSVLTTVPYAFHSSKLKVIKGETLQRLKGIRSEPPKIHHYSSVTGQLQTDPIDAKFIYRVLRRPGLLDQALKQMAKDLGETINDYLFIEISPSPMFPRILPFTFDNPIVISPLQKDKDEHQAFLESLQALHNHGVDINFMSQFTNEEINEYLQTNKKAKH